MEHFLQNIDHLQRSNAKLVKENTSLKKQVKELRAALSARAYVRSTEGPIDENDDEDGQQDGDEGESKGRS